MDIYKVVVKLIDGERIYSYMDSDSLNKFMNDISAGETFATTLGLAVRVENIDVVFAEKVKDVPEDREILIDVINTSNYVDELNREYERLKKLSTKY